MDRASAPGVGGTADDALAHWRGDEDLPAIERELEVFARGGDLDRLPRLHAVICGAGESSRFVGAIVERLVEALSAAPLAAVPLRHFFGPQMATLQLAEAAGATLSLHVLDRSAPPSAPETVCFVPLETWDRVICGDGVADLAVRPGPEAGAGPIAHCAVRLEQGYWYSRAGTGAAVVAYRHDRPLVLLRLQRRMAGAMACEYRLADGALLRRAAGSLQDSRHRLAVALLGAMRRRDAVPALAELATGEGAADLRWQAQREAIGLDSGAGFAALGAVANDVADPLQPPAAALRERLIAAHPVLAQVC
jgi:hypothetical protein